MRSTAKLGKRSLQWTQPVPGRVCFVDPLWNDRKIEVPAELHDGSTTVVLAADQVYEVSGYQDDLVISFGPYLLHVSEEFEGYDVLSITTSEEALLAAHALLGHQRHNRAWSSQAT